jgi:hypothetical protein
MKRKETLGKDDSLMLRQTIPRTGKLIATTLRRKNKKSKQIEEWREGQLLRLVGAAVDEVKELDRALKRGRLSTVAWCVRNLMELSVWSEYCNKSAANARRFLDDSVRDLYGFSEAVKALEGVDGGEGEHERDMATLAKLRGIASLDDGYKRVSEAAREIGRGEEFKALNKFLSKLAHPTAGMISVFGLPTDNSGLLETFFGDGLSFAVGCLLAVWEYVVSVYPECRTVDADEIIRENR